MMEDNEAKPRQSRTVEGRSALWSLDVEGSLPLHINQIQSPGQDDLFLKWWVEDFASPFQSNPSTHKSHLCFDMPSQKTAQNLQLEGYVTARRTWSSCNKLSSTFPFLI